MAVAVCVHEQMHRSAGQDDHECRGCGGQQRLLHVAVVDGAFSRVPPCLESGHALFAEAALCVVVRISGRQADGAVARRTF